MSGKRRLNSAGKWLLDNTGKAKICTCCGSECACKYRCYNVTVTAVSLPDCACEGLQAAVEATLTGLGAVRYSQGVSCPIAQASGTEEVCESTWAWSIDFWAAGACPTLATDQEIAITAYDTNDVESTCEGTATVTIEEVGCCGGDCPCAEATVAAATSSHTGPVIIWKWYWNGSFVCCTCWQVTGDASSAVSWDDEFWGECWAEGGRCIDIIAATSLGIGDTAYYSTEPGCPGWESSGYESNIYRSSGTSFSYNQTNDGSARTGVGTLLEDGLPLCADPSPIVGTVLPGESCYYTFTGDDFSMSIGCVDYEYVGEWETAYIPAIWQASITIPIDGDCSMVLTGSIPYIPGSSPAGTYVLSSPYWCCDITVTVECSADCSGGPYYLSCDIESTSYTDDGDITDCDGTGGTLYCTDTGEVIDWPLTEDTACRWTNTNGLEVDDPSRSFGCTLQVKEGGWSYYSAQFVLRREGGAWILIPYDVFPANPALTATQVTPGITPIGAYSDIDYCDFDGFVGSRVRITNIVVTA